jgi:phosphotriesterase-related protein
MDPDVELPTDRGRLRAIRAATDAGHGAQILVSHDICTRTRAESFGGHGYGHMLRNVVPLMQRMGFSGAEVAQLTRFNPLRLLALPQSPPAPEFTA